MTNYKSRITHHTLHIIAILFAGLVKFRYRRCRTRAIAGNVCYKDRAACSFYNILRNVYRVLFIAGRL